MSAAPRHSIIMSKCSARPQRYPDSSRPSVLQAWWQDIGSSPEDRFSYHRPMRRCQDWPTCSSSSSPEPPLCLPLYLICCWSLQTETWIGFDLMLTSWDGSTLLFWLYGYIDWSSPLVFILPFGHALAPSSHLAKSLLCWYLPLFSWVLHW